MSDTTRLVSAVDTYLGELRSRLLVRCRYGSAADHQDARTQLHQLDDIRDFLHKAADKQEGQEA